MTRHPEPFLARGATSQDPTYLGGQRSLRLSEQCSLCGAGLREAASMCPFSYSFALAEAVPTGSPPGDNDAHEVQKTSPGVSTLDSQLAPGLRTFAPLTFDIPAWPLKHVQ